MKKQKVNTQKFIFIYVTCPTKALAKKIATQLVNKKMCACANISPPVQSIYRWEGKIHTDREFVLILKSELKKFSQIENVIKKMHPYECPCVVALPLVRGSNFFNYLSQNLNLK